MNIGRFFLDVQGTITGNSDYDYMKEVGRAKQLIKELIIKDELDELRVSILTSDSIENVEEYAKLLEERLSGVNKLHFGYHHAEDKMIYLGQKIKDDKTNKCDQMIDNLKVCDHKVCYYADDSKINRVIAQIQIPRYFPDIKLVLFNPKNQALLGLNNEVEKYLKR